MKFETALKYLESGKKIRRTCWEVGHFWKKEEFKGIVNSVGETPKINVKQLQADDWEVMEEIEDRNDIIKTLEVVCKLNDIYNQLEKIKKELKCSTKQ